MQIGKAFRWKQSQAALQGCRIKKRMKNGGNDFSSPGTSYQDTIQRTAQFRISNIKYIDNRKKSEDCINKNLYSPSSSRVLPYSRDCQFDSPVRRDKLLDMCYQRGELMWPAIPKHKVAPLQAHLEARDKAHSSAFTAADTTTLLLPTATAPLLNLISSN